jgi:acyl-CoA synthetase (AMP-forming)/AMP-acid ligase II
LDDSNLADIDLSRCKAAIVGAERVDATVLAELARRLSSCGLRPSALRPAYGLAEATLAVSGSVLDSEPRYVQVEPQSTRFGEAIPIVGSGFLALDDVDGSLLISCGHPIPGTTVTIEDDDRMPVPEGTLGEIVVDAPWLGEMVTPGHPPQSPSSTLRTGDAGFQHDGELYVVGRSGDSLSIRGRRVFAGTLEAAVAAETGWQVVIVMAEDLTGPVVLCVAEGRVSSGWYEQLRSIVHRHVGDGVRSVFLAIARGALPRTTSGKPKRSVIWSRFVEGSYDERAIRIDGQMVSETLDVGGRDTPLSRRRTRAN